MPRSARTKSAQTARPRPSKPVASRYNNLLTIRNDKRGINIAPKALVYLIFVAIAIVFAAVVLVKAYNAFFSGAPQEDAAALAKIINEMLADKRPYIQRNTILRTGSSGIVGFDTETTVVSIENSKKGVKINLPRPTQCSGHACICTYKDSAVKNCYLVNAKDANTILSAGYEGLETTQGDAILARISSTNVFGWLPPTNGNGQETTWYYTQPVIIDSTLFESFVGGVPQKVNAADKPNQVIPVVIEKMERDGKTSIMLLPALDKTWNREFYLGVCSTRNDKEAQMDGGAACSGLTGAQSFAQFSRKAYCQIRTYDSRCEIVTVTNCADRPIDQQSLPIKKPCICDGLLVTSGFCTSDIWHAMNCEEVASCSDYCTLDEEKNCAPWEASACDANPCYITSGCTRKGLQPNMECTTP